MTSPFQKQTKSYIDKDKFYEVLTKYKNDCIIAESTGKQLPVVPDYIGTCFIELCENMARRYNFRNYTWRDDLVSDGIFDCLKALKNFDPSNTKKNPFGYFSMIVYRAFLRRIATEKQESDVKYKFLSSLASDEIFSMCGGDEEVYNDIMEILKNRVECNSRNK